MNDIRRVLNAKYFSHGIPFGENMCLENMWNERRRGSEWESEGEEIKRVK